LVADDDAALFRELEAPHRRVVTESELLPRWLRSYPDPFSLGRRRIWTGIGAVMRGVRPFRGWRAQQLRKLALPLRAKEDLFVFADSDMFFVKPYDMGSQVTSDGVRLYRKPLGIRADMHDHVQWCHATADILGLPEPTFPCDDYVAQMVTWTKQNVSALSAHIQRVNGKDWFAAILTKRADSEYIIYGYFVDHVLGPSSNHQPSEFPLVNEHWLEEELPTEGVRNLISTMADGQVAVHVQSFIPCDIEHLRHLLREVNCAFPAETQFKETRI
jgi:hypothetical protein